MKQSIRNVLITVIVLLSSRQALSQEKVWSDTGTTSGKTVFTLHDCLKKAVAESNKIKVSDLEVEIRENERKSMRGHYFPLVTLEGKAVRFNDRVDLDVDISFLSVLLQDFSALLSPETLTQLGQFQEQGLKIKVRDDFVYEGGVTVAQPLVQLYTIHAAERARNALVEAAKAEGISVRRKVEVDVVKAYIGLVAAINIQKTIETAIVQLTALETQTEQYVNAELVERNALLKVQVAKAEYEKKLSSAQKGADLARASLNMLMGRPLSAPLAPSLEGVSLSMSNVNPDDPLVIQQKDAVAGRPELAGARFGSEAADYGRKAAIGKMFPDLNLVFKYHNTQGTGAMQPENEYFGGILFSWNILDWGVDYYAMQAAKSKLHKVNAQLSDAEDMVKLDVESKWLDLKEARQTVAVSEKQSELAKENLRIEKMRYAATEATTSDLLEAQTVQIKAENELIIARVRVDAALYALAVARGIDLLQLDRN